MNATKKIYAIYANQDNDVLRYLLLHLQPLEKDFNLTVWSDDAVNPGQQWKPRETSRLDHTDIFLLLLSNTFMYSEFIKQDEFKAVIDRYKIGRATVIPILVDDCPWDVEFTSDDYNFSFNELLVFPKNKKPIGDWNTTDQVFKEVTDYVRGLLTSPGKMDVLEEAHKKSDKNSQNTNDVEQIAIDFFEEIKTNDKAEKEEKSKNEVEAEKVEEEKKLPEEEAEAKEVIRKEKRLRQKAEIQKRIEKEKELKEKAKKNKKIEVATELNDVPKEEKWENKEAKAKKAANRHYEIANSEIGSVSDKRDGEVLVAEERIIKKNRLAGHNYQFKIAKVVEAKSTVIEERRGNDEAIAQMTAKAKAYIGISKPESDNILKKRLGEVVTAQEMVNRKNRLTGYNYQFKPAKVVKAKRVVQEERPGNDEASVQILVAVKRRAEIVKSEIAAELKKRFGEVVAILKRTLNNGVAVVSNYKFKLSRNTHQSSKEAKTKNGTDEKRRIHLGFVIASLFICGLLIYVFSGNSEKQSTTSPEIETTEVTSDAAGNLETNSDEQAAAISKLGIGDTYEGGIVFRIDASNKTGKIAHFKDAGPMPWKDAIKIQEQLGEGWRLPTLDELETMYGTIGQGATNVGRFADELYWSATPYEEYQARLLRFMDGNTSYHYNKVVEDRKFLVRAIRDFSR